MEALEIRTIFTLTLFGMEIPITETIIVSWIVMVMVIVLAFILTRRLREIPTGPQAILEAGMEFLNNFAKNQFGSFSKFLGPYLGMIFLFMLFANIIGVLSPPEIKFMGHEFIPPFPIRPPTRDINVTAALAVISIFLVVIFGFAARGVRGWFKNLLHPIPLMLPFNILEYATRTMSLALRLFGNILGGYVLMGLIEKLLPVALPMVFSLYFDFFDGMLQASIFVFLTSLYLSEAVKVHE
ncbi:MAG: F0F1 ATP synthase subunit A [Treponema sp.]|nr:F0F1 ATP synthase subunit A [Treponema sp.]